MEDLGKKTTALDEFNSFISTFAASQLEPRKLHIAFWDKLVVLSAGTLALSLTAATTFRGHTIGDGGVGYLFASWKLLFLSTTLAVLAQFLGTFSTTLLPMIGMFSTSADNIEERSEGEYDDDINSIREQAVKSTYWDSMWWNSANLLGQVSVVCVLAALVFLIRFAQVNMRVFLRS